MTTTLALVATSAWAEPGEDPGWLERTQLTGDWRGVRTSLGERGLVPGARYTAGFWSNLSGGLEKGTRYEGFAQWWLEADLEELFGWKGGSFAIDWYAYHGGQPSEDLVGPFNSQTISGNETADSVRFYEIYLQQSWSDGRFVLKAGQLAADSAFFLAKNADALLNGTFGFLGIGRGTEVAPFFPLATPGAYFAARTADERWEARLGIYSADTGADESGNFGFDWAFDNGAFLIGELRAQRSPFGHLGTYAVGALGTTADVEDFERGGTTGGGYGFFASIDQLLIEETSKSPGIGMFVRGYATPQEGRSLAHWYVDVGVKLTRPFRQRPKDVFSLGYSYVRLSGDYVTALRTLGESSSKGEGVLELTYRLQLTGWLTLQPDLQFFFDPQFGGPDATVIGLRAVIEL